MFQVNLFGHMRVTRAILPLLRAQGSGCIAFTSSSTAWATLPFMSHYAASKAALSAYVESLHKEVRPLNLKCIAFECGGFPTHLGQPREESQAGFGNNGPAVSSYESLFANLVGHYVSNPMAHMPGDLVKGSAAMVDIIKGEGQAAGRPWAVRMALGSDGLGSARQKCAEMLQLLDRWQDVSVGTDRDGQEAVATQEMFEFTTILAPE